MKIRDSIPIKDLYFGVRIPKMSYSSSEERNQLETINLFGTSRVLVSVAMWVTWPESERKKHDFLRWCFSDVCARCEYEFIVCPWPYKDDEAVENCGRKVDIYEMYVEPNADLLRDLVDRVSVSSAKAYLAEWRKTYR